jgi:20S proteasome alpha/beta subunit
VTLILGMASKGGLLLVSDSQTTFDTAGQQIKLPSEKIFAPWSNVAWGASSNRSGTVQHVQQQLQTTFAERNRFKKKKRQEIRAAITAEISKRMKEVYTQAIQLPGMTSPMNSFLFIGYAQDGPMILEVHADLTDSDHVKFGFAATGSGEIFPYIALAGLKHFDVQDRTLQEAKLISYRIVQDAINAAAYGIGPPIQMIEIPVEKGEAGDARKLTDDELRILDEKVLEWKLAESEVLAKFVGLAPQPAPAAETAASVPIEAKSVPIEKRAEENQK